MDGVPPHGRMSRRTFLRASSVTLLAAPLVRWPSLLDSPHRFLTASEAAALNALCARIVPADEDPGAAEAGVLEFIDRKLVGYHRRHQALYRAGLFGVNESSLLLYSREFARLTPDQQDALLHRLEANDAPGPTWTRVPPREFFGRVVEHTLEGFYGGPRHGGNRDAVSWRMLGLPTPPVRSRRPLTADWS